MTTTQASSKKNEEYVPNNTLYRRKKLKLKFKTDDLVRKAYKRNIFSKANTTNCSNGLYSVTQVIHDTIPT